MKKESSAYLNEICEETVSAPLGVGVFKQHTLESPINMLDLHNQVEASRGEPVRMVFKLPTSLPFDFDIRDRD